MEQKQTPTMTEKAKVLFDFVTFLGSKSSPFSIAMLPDLAREFREANNIDEFVAPPTDNGPPKDAMTFVCPQRPPMHTVFNYPSDSDWWRGDNTCSYCGSMHPNEFMELVKAGAELIPTDKNYKVYLRHPTNAQQKFYFDHLTIDQKNDFIDLLNEKKLRLAEPGRFYVLPFFMQVVEPAA